MVLPALVNSTFSMHAGCAQEMLARTLEEDFASNRDENSFKTAICALTILRYRRLSLPLPSSCMLLMVCA